MCLKRRMTSTLSLDRLRVDGAVGGLQGRARLHVDRDYLFRKKTKPYQPLMSRD